MESDYSPRAGERNYIQAKIPILQNKPPEEEEKKQHSPARLVNPSSPVAPRSIPVSFSGGF